MSCARLGSGVEVVWGVAQMKACKFRVGVSTGLEKGGGIKLQTVYAWLRWLWSCGAGTYGMSIV